MNPNRTTRSGSWPPNCTRRGRDPPRLSATTVAIPAPRLRTRTTLGSSRSVIGSSGAGGEVDWMKVPSASTSLAPSEADTENCRVTSRPGSGG